MLGALLFAVTTATACPLRPPTTAVAIERDSPGCHVLNCAVGQPITFSVQAQSNIVSWPWVFGYQIQACDTITWDFGDGSPTVTTQGRQSVQHTFTSTANRTVTATITNTLGTATTSSSVAIDDVMRIELGKVQVREDAGVAILPLRRMGGLTRSGSLRLTAGQDYPYAFIRPFSQVVSFGPGETQKSVPIPIVDDATYRGGRTEFVFPEDAVGAVAVSNGLISIREDEPLPEVTVDDVTVIEGDHGTTEVTLTARLSGPVGEPYALYVEIDDPHILIANPPEWPAQTAARDEDFVPGTVLIFFERGQLTGTAKLIVKSDVLTESDEVIVLALSAGHPWLDFPRRYATCTIVDDDAVGDPPPMIAAIQPAFGHPLTTVEIEGSGFSEQCIVSFGAAPALPHAVTPDKLYVFAPAHAGGSVDVTVTCPGGATTKATGFTYFGKRRSV